MITAFTILVVLALIFAALSIPWPSYPLLAVAVILLAVAMLIGNRTSLSSAPPAQKSTRTGTVV